MNFEDTYFPLFRSMITHRYMTDANKFQFWVWCLLKASHKPHKQLVGNQTVNLEIGQFIFGRKAAARELGTSEQSVRTLVKFFLEESNPKLTIKSTNKFSVITVVKYACYMNKARQSNQVINQSLTNGQPAPNHDQEGKEGKEVKPSSSVDEVEGNFYLTKKGKKLSGQRLESFEKFWAAFGYKASKAEAADAWLAIPLLTEAIVGKIVKAAQAECSRRPGIIAEGKTPKMAQGWLSGRRWEDEALTEPAQSVMRGVI